MRSESSFNFEIKMALQAIKFLRAIPAVAIGFLVSFMLKLMQEYSLNLSNIVQVAVPFQHNLTKPRLIVSQELIIGNLLADS